MNVRIICKRCGKTDLSENFKLDAVWKMVVCSNCQRERRNAGMAPAQATKKVEAEKVARPAGWDEDEIAIEKMHKQKSENTVVVQKIDAERVKYKCPKCSYTFTYNTIEKRPKSCGYCGKEIGRITY